MDFCKSFSIGPVNIYVTTSRMKRRNKRDDPYRNNRKKTLRMKHQIWKRNGGRCEECGREFDEELLEVHHIVPVCERPDLICSQSNIHIVCPECHNRLHGRPLGGALLEKLMNEHKKIRNFFGGCGFFCIFAASSYR